MLLPNSTEVVTCTDEIMEFWRSHFIQPFKHMRNIEVQQIKCDIVVEISEVQNAIKCLYGKK